MVTSGLHWKLLFGVSFLCVNVAVNLMVTRTYVQKTIDDRPIVTVDAAKTMLQFAQSRPQDLSEEAWIAQVRGLNASIEPAIHALGARSDVLILNSAAVLSGAADFTPHLVSELLKASEGKVIK